MPRPPRARQPIKDAALALFVEHGIAGTGIREIARHAGCSEAALYRHWANKEDLVASLYSEHLTEVNALIQGELATDASLAERIQGAVTAVFALYDQQPAVFRFVLLQRHEVAGLLDPETQMPQDLIEALVGEVISDPRQCGIVAAAVLGTFLQVAEYVHYGRLDGKLSGYASDVADLIRRQIGDSA